MKKSEATADYIKKLAIDPNTASAIARSGVTFNDTPEEINTKLAKDGQTQDKIKTINSYTKSGYQYLATPAQQSLYKGELFTAYDTGGNPLVFRKPKTAAIASGLDVNVNIPQDVIAGVRTLKAGNAPMEDIKTYIEQEKGFL